MPPSVFFQSNLRLSQQLLRLKPSKPQLRRWFASDVETLQAGDRVLLRYKNDPLILTKPLRPEGITTTRFGDVAHDSIIGRRLRDIVTTSKRWELRVHLPTLDEYVRLTPRLVTPVYPADANLIVSLLDLHPTSQLHSANSPIEILEAGTGHGALTLYLARAIHAANLPSQEKRAASALVLPDEKSSVVQLDGPIKETVGIPASMGDVPRPDSTSDSTRHRHATIHSLDISPKHSEHATKIVQGFRRGLYSNDVKFHIGDVSDWVDHQLTLYQSNNAEPADNAFLSHILLDLPSSHDHATKIASVLHVDGNLVVFTPSITQLVKWVTEVRKKRLPLLLDQVLELGQGISGGRQWDVRSVKPRALLRQDNTKPINVTNAVQNESQNGQDQVPKVQYESSDQEAAAGGPQAHEEDDDDFGWEDICRPKVGEKVIGGGFVGVWKKMRARTA